MSGRGRRVAAGVVALAALFMVATGEDGCSSSNDPLQDLPLSKVTAVQPEVVVYVSPDQFPNVVTYCVVGKPARRVYLTTRVGGGDAIHIVDDVGCEGNALNEAPSVRPPTTTPAFPRVVP